MEHSTYLDQLIDRCAQGNSKAQQEVFEAYSAKMLSLTYRYTADTMEAEDIVMVGFNKVFDKISTYNGSGSFEGWMRKIMINSALSFYQGNQKRIRTVSLEQTPDHPIHCYNNTDVEYLQLALKGLPEGLRIPFTLFAIEGLSHKKIALELQITETLSKVRVARARKALREALRENPLKQRRLMRASKSF
jgi:RNA polymerase sigma-70 factor (ECF subfamily)